MNHLLYDFEFASKSAVNTLNSCSNSELFKQISLLTSEDNILLSNKDNVGFFYFHSTRFHLRLFEKIAHHLPEEPFLFGYLVHKWEIPWAKLFPLRLYLRLGEQFNGKIYCFIF